MATLYAQLLVCQSGSTAPPFLVSSSLREDSQEPDSHKIIIKSLDGGASMDQEKYFVQKNLTTWRG